MVGFAIVISCLPVLYRGSINNLDSSNIFYAIQNGLVSIIGIFWIFIVLEKIFKFSVIFPVYLILFFFVFGLFKYSWKKDFSQLVVLIVLVFVLFFTLGEFGSFISKWDGAAHQTIVTKMMANDTLLLSNTNRLDYRLQGYQTQPYYPHLIHSIIAAFSSVLTQLGLRAQQCFLALSVVLPFLSISSLVVAANKFGRNTSALHSFVLLLFALAVPATLFSQSHHGSFARAIASVLAIGLYVQLLGDFRKVAILKKSGIIALMFAVHLQGALFAIILLISEVMAYSYKKTHQVFYNFVGVILLATITISIFLYGNSYYFEIVNRDALSDLFGIWRIEIISSASAWVNYSFLTIFGVPNKIHGAIKLCLMLIGCAYLWRYDSKILVTLILFMFGSLLYVFLLLYLPEGSFIRLLSSPFAGAVSRLYEGISIVVLLLAAIGLIRVLNFRINIFNILPFKIVLVVLMVEPALFVQNDLFELAKKFDTLQQKEMLVIENNIKSSKLNPALILAEDNKYMALDNAYSIRSYLSYFDCPLPYDNSPECFRRLNLVNSVSNAVTHQEAINDLDRSSLDFLIKSGYKNIYLILTVNPDGEPGAAIYEYLLQAGKFVKVFDIPR